MVACISVRGNIFAQGYIAEASMELGQEGFLPVAPRHGHLRGAAVAYAHTWFRNSFLFTISADMEPFKLVDVGIGSPMSPFSTLTIRLQQNPDFDRGFPRSKNRIHAHVR